MKTFLMGAVSIAALIVAGSAYAAGDSSTVTQTGGNNTAGVDQTLGTSETSTIDQISSGNNASVTQYGSNDTSSVTQDTDGVTDGSTAVVEQLGNTAQPNNVTINQKGASYAGILQDTAASGETAYIYQQGNNPGSWTAGGATIYQNGTGQTAFNFETGNYNNAIVIQTGTGGQPINDPFWGGEAINTPPNAVGLANIYSGGGNDLTGNQNFASVEQQGYQSFALNDVGEGYGNGGGSYNSQTIIQDAGSYNAVASNWTEIGSHNTDYTYQTGGSAGGSGPLSWTARFGDYDSTNVYQNGASTSNIGQGTIAADVSNFGESSYTTGASATVSQTGANQLSNILQNDAASATVTQVENGGSANTSTVTQNLGSAGSNATVSQSGQGGGSTVTESGGYELASVTQTGASTGATSLVNQAGYGDQATVGQSGASDNSDVEQQLAGSYDTASVTQSGASDQSTVTQSGYNDYALVSQASNNAFSTVTQSGANDISHVHQ